MISVQFGTLFTCWDEIYNALNSATPLTDKDIDRYRETMKVFYNQWLEAFGDATVTPYGTYIQIPGDDPRDVY